MGQVVMTSCRTVTGKESEAWSSSHDMLHAPCFSTEPHPDIYIYILNPLKFVTTLEY